MNSLDKVHWQGAIGTDLNPPQPDTVAATCCVSPPGHRKTYSRGSACDHQASLQLLSIHCFRAVV